MMKSSDKNRAILAEVIARSWRQPDFREQLKKDPKKTLREAGISVPEDEEVVLLENTPSVINAVLPPRSEMGTYAGKFDKAVEQLRNLPEGIEVRIVRDTDKKSHVVVPAVPAAIASGELSDAELEQVAGGESSTSTYQAAEVQTTTEATGEVEATVQTTAEATYAVGPVTVEVSFIA